MDIAGAKALKKRLAANGADAEAAPAPAADVSEDAPPVYQWTGVSRPEPPATEESDRGVSRFRRLALSFR